MKFLVVDAGTSSLRAGVIDSTLRTLSEHVRPQLPTSPADGLVEFDAVAMARAAVDAASEALDEVGPVDAMAIVNQRGSTVVWESATGRPVAPGLGWQDLRTVGRCLELGAEGLHLAPNQTATKIEALLLAAGDHDPGTLLAGTVDTWLVWNLTRGATHVTDATNAAVTGLVADDGKSWDSRRMERLGIPDTMLGRIVDTAGVVGSATALPGAPPIAGIAGDQQASLIGQGCVRRGDAKITFGTGGMLDVVVGAERPSEGVTENGGYPIVAWRDAGEDTWGLEAIMLAAGTNVEWLRDGLGIIDSVADSSDVASACEDTGDVWFVPALLGLGTPEWDFGARGTFVGLTRGTGTPEMVRAVLEGVAHRGADLVDAATADTDLAIDVLRIDGGMAENAVFAQALADATERPVEVAPVREATSLGGAFVAGIASGTWSGFPALADTWAPRARYEPTRVPERERWREAVARAGGWHPALSALDLRPR